jgi:hypothetical protein
MRKNMRAVKYSGNTPIAQNPIENTTKALARMISSLTFPGGGIRYSTIEPITTIQAITLRIFTSV